MAGPLRLRCRLPAGVLCVGFACLVTAIPSCGGRTLGNGPPAGESRSGSGGESETSVGGNGASDGGSSVGWGGAAGEAGGSAGGIGGTGQVLVGGTGGMPITPCFNRPIGAPFCDGESRVAICRSETSFPETHELCVTRCVGAECEEPGCGNGFREPDEHCDDGNLTRGDGCSELCQWEPVQIAAGFSHSCVRFEGGQLKCWGNNSFGQLGLGSRVFHGAGDNSMGAKLPTVELGQGREALEIAVGSQQTCALLDDGSIKCWGNNGYGQLGQGDTSARGDDPGEMGDALRSVDIGWPRALAIRAQGQFSCALLDNGDVKCWGRNRFGALGMGDRLTRGDTPGSMGEALPIVDLGRGAVATDLSLGLMHACALLRTGAVKCWGANDHGQLGLGDRIPRGDHPGEMGDALPAVDLGAGRAAVAIAAGEAHTCALLDSGELKCWGYASSGALGLGDRNNRGDEPGEMGDLLPPVDVGSEGPIERVAAGANTCVVFQRGTVKCWGSNHSGELGQGDTTSRGMEPNQLGDLLLPIEIGAVRAVAAGPRHACALLDDGTVKCWGNAHHGVLGNETGSPWLSLGDEPGELGDQLPAVELW